MRARNIYLGIGFISVLAVCIAVFLQETWQLNACTLCIIQRYLYLGLALFSFLCAAKCGRQGWLIGIPALFAFAGLATAARNVWVLYVPSFTCGRDKLAAAVNALPTAEAWPALFEANGLCSESPAAIVGIPFPILSGLTFVGLLLGLAVAYRAARRERVLQS